MMERLTNKREADAQREEYERRLANGYPRNIPEERFLRLAAYEDTGLSPQACAEAREAGKVLSSCDISFGRLAELLTADKEGRLVVLPCKVGDVVYGFHSGQTILPMVAKWVETSADGWTIAVQYTPMAPKFYLFSDFGKTVFLTREEAEKALEAMKEGETE